MLVVGALLGGQFVSSAPALVRAIEEAVESGHVTLGLMGMLYPGGRTVGTTVIGGVAAALLTTVGIVLLRGRRGPSRHADV